MQDPGTQVPGDSCISSAATHLGSLSTPFQTSDTVFPDLSEVLSLVKPSKFKYYRQIHVFVVVSGPVYTPARFPLLGSHDVTQSLQEDGQQQPNSHKLEGGDFSLPWRKVFLCSVAIICGLVTDTPTPLGTLCWPGVREPAVHARLVHQWEQPFLLPSWWTVWETTLSRQTLARCSHQLCSSD